MNKRKLLILMLLTIFVVGMSMATVSAKTISYNKPYKNYVYHCKGGVGICANPYYHGSSPHSYQFLCEKKGYKITKIYGKLKGKYHKMKPIWGYDYKEMCFNYKKYSKIKVIIKKMTKKECKKCKAYLGWY